MNNRLHSGFIETGDNEEEETMLHFQSNIATIAERVAKRVGMFSSATPLLPFDRRWLLGLFGLAGISAAHAQVGQFAQNQQIVPQAQISRAMGECVLKRDRSDAIAAVTNNTDTPAFKKAAHAVEPDMVACLRGQRSATIGTLDFRGAVAEALLAENDAALLAKAASITASPAQRIAGGEGIGAAFAMIDCAVAAAPSSAADLMRSGAATPAEAAAFRNLGQTLQQCAPASGAVKLKTFQVRPMTAIALYRLVGNSKS